MIARAALGALLACACGVSGSAQGAAHRVIVVSYDSFNERRVVGELGPTIVPTFAAMSRGAACTDGARPMYPSLTAASHAAIWTGAWGHVNGIAGNRLGVPASDTGSAWSTGDGFLARNLDAEPAWLAFARQGKRVVALHVTQAPHAPGYPWKPDGAARRAQADSLLALERLWVLNGYNDRIATDTVLSDTAVPIRPAGRWRGMERLPRHAPPPREIGWAIGSDSAFALLTGVRGRYDRMWIAVGGRDLRRAVRASAIEARPALAAQPLARHFSRPRWVRGRSGRSAARWRLFAIDSAGTHFTLFQPEINVMDANREWVARSYLAAVPGFVGNGADGLWTRGMLGATYREHGTGVAEARYLESVELAAQLAMQGVQWSWRAARPDALLTYLSIGDGVDHLVWGEALPASVVADDTARVRSARALRAAVWGYADRHLALLRSLAAERAGTAVFVTGDHGMRANWKTVRVNVALADAGLATLDARGRVIPAQSQVFTPAGYWLTVNTRARGGPVTDDSASLVLGRAEHVLGALRDSAGQPIFTAFRRPLPGDSLGIGGPAGGDSYWDLQPGWIATPSWSGPTESHDATSNRRPVTGNHGFTSTDADMRSAFCAWGTGLAARRLPTARVIDVIPTAAAWLGVLPPRDAVGASWLPVMRAPR